MYTQGGDVVQVEEAPPQMMTNDQAMRGHQSSQMMMNDPHVRSHQVPQTMIHDPGMRGYQSPQMTMNDPMVRGYQSPQTMNSSVGMGIQQQPHYHSMQQMRPPVQERGHPPPRHPVIICE